MSENTELAVVERPAPLSMVDGPDPAGAMAYAQSLARQLTTIVAGATTKIQGRDHVNIEGWQSLAAATGHTCEVEWSRPMEGIEANARGVLVWEARAAVRDQAGHIVATAESMADPSEGAPWGKNNYSVRGMAQTRAMSRALASRMRYVVRLGGMEATPAEEMPEPAAAVDPKVVARERYKVLREFPGMDEDVLKSAADPKLLADDAMALRLAYDLGATIARAEAEVIEGEVVDAPETPAVIDAAGMRKVHAAAKKAGMDHDAIHALALEVFPGIESTKQVPAAHLDDFLRAIETRGAELAAAKQEAA